jgi:RimJ/RimL family protein N-acetyltransferase
VSTENGPRLLTDRLLLRRWTDDDLVPFAAINTDPEVTRLLRGPMDRALSDALVARAEDSFETRGYGLWATEVRATGELIGFVGLARQTFDAPFNPSVEVGWRLARSAWGHGYATEGGRAALDFGFDVIGLEEIVSITTASNERSRAVMRRLGMTRDPADDFEQPQLPAGHPLRPAVLHRIDRARWELSRA